MFGAGCFWGVQYYFDQVPGVVKTTVGYSGGTTEDPTYEEVEFSDTGHAEVVLLEYDTRTVSFETLCKHFFRIHDPTTLNRQGPDVGECYRSVIFYVTDEQRQTAENVKADAQKDWKSPIVTQIEQAGPFYEAEEYHQKFTERTGRGMCHVPYETIS